MGPIGPTRLGLFPAAAPGAPEKSPASGVVGGLDAERRLF